MDRGEAFGVLLAWRSVGQTSWPQLCPTMVRRSVQWPALSAADLEREIAFFLAQMDAPEVEARLFWKIGPDLPFVGANAAFVRDSGFASLDDLRGKTDMHRDIAWARQGAKYRRDDEEVMQSGQPRLGIVERQDTPAGTTWVHTGKVPIRATGSGVVGVLGMYEVVDTPTAARLMRRRDEP